MPNLRDEIEKWDGKSSHFIENVYKKHQSDAHLLKGLVDLMKSVRHQKGATWILKKYLESTAAADAVFAESVYSLAHKLSDWESRLHLLQSMPYLPISKSTAARAERFIRAGLAGKNKFVRAWAYNGFYLLATQHPRHQSEATKLLNMGLRDEPASVKARIKKCLKTGF